MNKFLKQILLPLTLAIALYLYIKQDQSVNSTINTLDTSSSSDIQNLKDQEPGTVVTEGVLRMLKSTKYLLSKAQDQASKSIPNSVRNEHTKLLFSQNKQNFSQNENCQQYDGVFLTSGNAELLSILEEKSAQRLKYRQLFSNGEYSESDSEICVFQAFNHFPNIQFTREFLAQGYRELQKQPKTTKGPVPNCVGQASRLFGVYYRLHDISECKNFFKLYNQPYFQEFLESSQVTVQNNEQATQQTPPQSFYLQTGLFNQSLRPINNTELRLVADDFRQGDLCTAFNYQPLILQSFAGQRILPGFRIRVHILISSLQPFIVYLHQKTQLLRCQNEQTTTFTDCLSIQEISEDDVQSIDQALNPLAQTQPTLNLSQLKRKAFIASQVLAESAAAAKRLRQQGQSSPSDARFYELLAIDFAIEIQSGELIFTNILTSLDIESQVPVPQQVHQDAISIVKSQLVRKRLRLLEFFDTDSKDLEVDRRLQRLNVKLTTTVTSTAERGHFQLVYQEDDQQRKYRFFEC